jgi:hypothetical protein
MPELQCRFIALNTILSHTPTPIHADGIPKNNRDACIWVWKAAMERGDFSPLILHPRERVVGSNLGLGTPSWLVGCHSFGGVEWDLRREIKSASLQLAVNGGVVEAELYLAGVIEEIDYLEVDKSDNVAGVGWAIERLLSMARGDGTVFSAKHLVDGLNRVFPVQVHDAAVSRVLHDRAFSYEELQERDEQLAYRINGQLANYVDAPEGGPGRIQREAAVVEIAQILELE